VDPAWGLEPPLAILSHGCEEEEEEEEEKEG
jgi:hypothetical protein